MNRATRVEYYDEACLDFATDACLMSIVALPKVLPMGGGFRDGVTVKPDAKYWVKGEGLKSPAIKETESAPAFTVVETKKVSREYKTHDMSSTVLSYNLVLMDGSGTMFKATVNSGLSHYFAAYNLYVGSTVFVDDYAIITQTSNRSYTYKMYMLIKDFRWKLSPNKKVIDLLPIIMRDVVPATGHIYRAPVVEKMIDAKAIRAVSRLGAVVPLEEKSTSIDAYESIHCLMKAPDKGPYFHGNWIQHELSRQRWREQMDFDLMKSRGCDMRENLLNTFDLYDEEENKRGSYFIVTQPAIGEEGHHNSCQCCSEYGFIQCILLTLPLEDVDVNDLYLSVSSRLNGELDGDSFDDLAPNHKRWCFYWYYAVNGYKFVNGRKQLPTCFVKAVRSLYPNPRGVRYSTFMPTDPKKVLEEKSIMSAGAKATEGGVKRKSLDLWED